ncbi:60S ribosomal export protein NMD3 [Morella rubra]|uniref:60S ribosomal export protein NMD3 n=1 Tax=Morella rubra TaxID=262757 RepID=A0A6A1VZ19_9ROSI|nr:60S ribosomal export protein NMD3 [Morella rubra]
MAPNAANMCVKCLRSEVDITEGLQKQVTIMHCPECNTYLQPPRTWIKAQLESKELLTFCVKRLKNLNEVRLVHAEFIWTEPHSKRIKANPDQRVAAVQLRQHVSHRRTFFYLEQLILKHSAAAAAIKIKQMEQGIDFFFANRSHGVKFLEFIVMIEIEKCKGLVLPDAVLTKKSFEEKRQKKRGKPRAWKLKSLDMEVDDKGRAEQEKTTTEHEQFLKDLEENPDMRFNISLYRNKENQPSEMTSVTDGEDLPSVPLEELLADLDLREEEDEGDSMRE